MKKCAIYAKQPAENFKANINYQKTLIKDLKFEKSRAWANKKARPAIF